MLQNVQFYLLNMVQPCSGVDYPGAMTGIYPKGAIVYWPEGALFRNPFGTGPPEGPLSLCDNGGFGFIFVSEKIFLCIH
jgi:hypothetical protein